MQKIIFILLIIMTDIVMTIIWHKKINPDTTWIYIIYALVITVIYILFALIV